MSVRLLTSANDLQQYNQWVKQHPQGSLWQSVEWKTYQEALGRETRVYSHENASLESREIALVIIDRTMGGFSTWDIPRGPLSASSALIQTIVADAKKDKCLSLYLSPIQSLKTQDSRLKTSPRHQQPEATRILDLTLSDEQLLAQMHQKGRYNMNVARKNEVTVERSTDIDAYYALAKKTGKRDQFGIPGKKQLQAFIDHLPGSFLLLAKHDGKEIAGLIGVTWNGTGVYYYGASDYEHRALMAPYLLQWEAIQFCKKAGCRTYDLLGIAPEGAGKDHPWSGISDFKAKFGGTVITYPPEQEMTLRPMVKKLLEIKRKLIK